VDVGSPTATIPDTHPLHSEAIEADVLVALSNGKQLLRGNSVFDPSTSARSIALEVWQDSGETVTVHRARLGVRPLTRLGRDPCIA
jgi:hypothetical protein